MYKLVVALDFSSTENMIIFATKAVIFAENMQNKNMIYKKKRLKKLFTQSL